MNNHNDGSVTFEDEHVLKSRKREPSDNVKNAGALTPLPFTDSALAVTPEPSELRLGDVNQTDCELTVVTKSKIFIVEEKKYKRFSRFRTQTCWFCKWCCFHLFHSSSECTLKVFAEK